MLMPGIFGENFMDGFMEPFKGFAGNRLMQTDVKENENGYEVIMNVPGVKKEDLQAKLENGYLIVSASVNRNNDRTDENGNYIRRERYSGSTSRQFYVGEEVTQEDIKAKFENGTLVLNIPKKEPAKQVENKQFITIEG